MKRSFLAVSTVSALALALTACPTEDTIEMEETPEVEMPPAEPAPPPAEPTPPPAGPDTQPMPDDTAQQQDTLPL